MVDTATTSASLSDSNLNGRPDVRHTVYLITGANRGLGKSLVELLLKRSYTIVIACVRDMTTAPSGALDWQDSPAAANSSLIVIQLDSTKTHAAQEAVRQLRVVHSINHIDVVIANAGICNDQGSMSNLPLEDLQEHMMVNAHAVLLLFQATQPLLEEAGTGQARFVLIGAQAGCITAENMGAVPLAAYSLSKLAAHFMIRRLHLENDWLVSFVVDPGFVQTDMGNRASRLFGRLQAPTTIAASTAGILLRIDEATKKSVSGHFVRWDDGSRLAW